MEVVNFNWGIGACHHEVLEMKNTTLVNIMEMEIIHYKRSYDEMFTLEKKLYYGEKKKGKPHT